MQITRGIIAKAQKVVIYGPEGIGKSSFASDFPEPLFIDTEGSTNLMNVARAPRPTSWSMLLGQIDWVKKNSGCCKTLIIDTIDWAEQLCVEHVCATHNKKGVEDFGYGNGYVYVKEEFGRLLNKLQDIVDIGINTVLTAHAQIRKFEQPDEAGSYDRYELKLGKKTGSQTSPLVKEWADMVLFANYKTIVVTVEKKKKAQGGERVMHTVHHPSWDAKNRHDLDEVLPLAYSSIASCIPNDPQFKGASKPQMEPPVTVTQQQPIKQEEIKQDIPPNNKVVSETDRYFYHPESDSYWILKKGEAIPTDQDAELSVELNKDEWEERKFQQENLTGDKCSVCGEPQFNTPSGVCCKNGHGGADPAKPASIEPPGEPVPRALDDLMTANQVTVDEIKKVVASKGYYPLNTPIANYDPGFIDGVLIGAWEQVFNAIKMDRELPFN